MKVVAKISITVRDIPTKLQKFMSVIFSKRVFLLVRTTCWTASPKDFEQFFVPRYMRSHHYVLTKMVSTWNQDIEKAFFYRR